MKRLFITTGLISLVNALTIVQNDNQPHEDTLLILSFNQDENLKQTSLRIASLHNFKQILFFKKEKELLKNIDIHFYDEVYSVTMTRLYKYLNKHSNWYLFDEGAGYAISDIRKYKNLKRFYYTNFLNKFELADFPETMQICSIDKNRFLTISDQIIEILHEPMKLSTDRNVLFIGHYIYRKLGENFTLDYYKKYISLFLKLGYNVYFKAHPRDEDILIPKLKETFKDDKFHIFQSSLPIEIYNYNFNIAAGSYSGTLISLPHYRKIPAINLPMKELYLTNVGMNFKKFFALYDEYTPSLNDLKPYLPESKDILWTQYKNIIKNKPKISYNTKLKEIILYKSNPLQDVVFTVLSLVFKFNKNLSQQIHNIARYDFNKKLQKFY